MDFKTAMAAARAEAEAKQRKKRRDKDEKTEISNEKVISFLSSK